MPIFVPGGFPDNKMKTKLLAMLASWKATIIRKWDWWIYRRAYPSLRRMIADNPGLGYLFELHIRKWNAEQDISPELKRSTEQFHKHCTTPDSRQPPPVE